MVMAYVFLKRSFGHSYAMSAAAIVTNLFSISGTPSAMISATLHLPSILFCHKYIFNYSGLLSGGL